MAWNFRKSFKLGPVRITLTKRGVSASVGNKFARYSVNSRGQKRVTTRIPGTGIYNTKTISRRRSVSPKAR